MKAVLISIKPKWCEIIASGEKTVEVRKTKPKLETPFKVYIYQTRMKWAYTLLDKLGFEKLAEKLRLALGKVIGEFVCVRIDTIGKRGINNNFDYCYLSLNEFGNDDIEVEITDIKKSCIPKFELNLYGEASFCLYAWHISDLVIYEEPRELEEFYGQGKGNEHFYYDYCAGCPHHETPTSEYPCNECDGNRKYLYTPPQSWCYVEEVGR